MNMASSAVAADMIVYLMREYHMDMASGSNLIYFWSALTNVAPVIEACMADSSVGRFRMIGFGSVLCFLIRSDNSPTVSPMHLSGSDGYFSWYDAVSALSIIVAMTGLVYIQENMGWELGFGVLVVLSFLAALSFFLGSPFYVKPKPKKSLITGFIQVIVASYRNRHLNISSSGSYHSQGTKPILPTQTLRQACIVEDPERNLTCDGGSLEAVQGGSSRGAESVDKGDPNMDDSDGGGGRDEAGRGGEGGQRRHVHTVGGAAVRTSGIGSRDINGIPQNEFYISEFPESMSGIASNLSDLGTAVGTLLASMVMSIINELSGRGGQQSWIASNINEGHYDYFNWVLAGLSMLNFVVFLVFSKAFGPCRDEVIDATVVVEEGD
nr:protein NRT1/ PTR FAMILY 1.2-like isoform X3 [Ipomoea trifida]